MRPDENTGIRGPRSLVYGCLLGIAFWVIALLVFVGIAKADHMACSRPAFTWPLTVSIDADAPNPTAWRNAMAEWNAMGTKAQFAEVATGGEVRIVSSYQWRDGQTAVFMPCGTTKSIVYSGTDVDLDYWATHEMGHTLGFADHISNVANAGAYLNPRRCPDAYSGVMSYCTHRSGWWSALDRAMLIWWMGVN